ncbi:MAG: MBL fold metallo-hydrolase, partial [Gracilibacteraceae bacterium]|nr:MBL fold metallo-hydrolase [Gracilibacteraceae bacterium]
MNFKFKRLFIFLLLASAVLFAACGALPAGPPGPPAPPATAIADPGLTVYFIDVGQADAALVVCAGETMLIDGGNAEDSDLIYAFLKNRHVSRLNYIVATHAHEDHIGGLAGALNYAAADTAYCPVTAHESKAFGDFVKYLAQQGKSITVPNPGDRFTLGSAEVEILGPLRPSDEPNNTSIVLKLTYGDVSFLFTGDCERDEEADILAAGFDLAATVLKVGHHGSSTSTSYPFLREITPRYAVISCGENNSYGHPHEETLSKLRDADVTLYRTDMQGTITAFSDGKTVSFSPERNAGAVTNPTAPAPAAPAVYIGNVNSHVLHSPECGSLPAERNRVYFDSLAEALAAGYEKHRACLPLARGGDRRGARIPACRPAGEAARVTAGETQAKLRVIISMISSCSPAVIFVSLGRHSPAAKRRADIPSR